MDNVLEMILYGEPPKNATPLNDDDMMDVGFAMLSDDFED